MAVRSVPPADVLSSLDQLRQLAESLLGPGGRSCALRNTVGGPWRLSRLSSVVLAQLWASTPGAACVLREVRALLSEFGDGGSLALLLACSLPERLSPPHPLPRLLHTLRSAEEDVARLLAAEASPPDLSLRGLMAFGRSVLHRKLLFPGPRLDALVRATVQAVVSGLHGEGAQIVLYPPQLLLQPAPGGHLSAEVVPGVLLPVRQPRAVQRRLDRLVEASQGSVLALRAVLVTDGLSGAAAEVCDELVLTAGTEGLRQQQRRLLVAWGRRLADAGVTALLAQRVVEPSLRRWLSGRGVLVVERLGAASALRLASVLDWAPMPGPLADSEGGACGCVRALGVHARLRWLSADRAALHLAAEGPCCLLVSAGVDEMLCDVGPATEALVAAVTRLLTARSRTCPGAGHCERLLARHFKDKGEEELAAVFRRAALLVGGREPLMDMEEEEAKDEKDYDAVDEVEVKIKAVQCALRTVGLLLRTDLHLVVTGR